MIAGIDKSELELLKFSKAEIEQKLLWKHNREFQYQGEFYDVVQKETRGDSVFYWCWWDQEETELEKKLQKLVASHWNHDPIQKNKTDTIQKLFKHLFHETAAAFQNMSFFNPGCQAFWNYLESKPEINILQHDPPPRFLFQALQP